ncbi:MAG: DNRLRE domain-containing protein, partial [bacterium]
DPDENPFDIGLSGTGSSGGGTFTFNPTDDAHVKSSSPTINYGSVDHLRSRVGSTVYHSYLKFSVTGVLGTVSQATLRLYVTNASPDGGSVFAVSNAYDGTATPWDETGLIFNNAPAIAGTELSSAGSVSVGNWVELDVTSALAGDGIVSFGIKNAVSNSVFYSSKEGIHAPELVVVTAPSVAQPTAPEELLMAHTPEPLPQEISLRQNYPNPFNAGTTIEYDLPTASRAKLVVYNARGQEVIRIKDEYQQAGKKKVRWDGRNSSGIDVGSGVYFLYLKVGSKILTRKLTLQK